MAAIAAKTAQYFTIPRGIILVAFLMYYYVALNLEATRYMRTHRTTKIAHGSVAGQSEAPLPVDAINYLFGLMQSWIPYVRKAMNIHLERGLFVNPNFTAESKVTDVAMQEPGPADPMIATLVDVVRQRCSQVASFDPTARYVHLENSKRYSDCMLEVIGTVSEPEGVVCHIICVPDMSAGSGRGYSVEMSDTMIAPEFKKCEMLDTDGEFKAISAEQIPNIVDEVTSVVQQQTVTSGNKRPPRMAPDSML